MSDDDSTEIFKPVTSFDGYRVGNLGTVQSCRRRGNAKNSHEWHTLIPAVKNGYLSVQLYRDGKVYCRLVHDLVLQEFVGPRSPRMQCRHLDGIRKNCQLTNLTWGTCKENTQDRIRHGTMARGSKSGLSKLREADIPEIRSLRAAGETIGDIAILYGVTDVCISCVCLGKTWRHVPG